MSSKGYSFLTWLMWKIASRVVRHKLAQNRSKLIAGGVVVGVVLAGFALAAGDDERS